MNRNQLTSITVAMACVFAVGVAASTLSSTLDSDPADAVQLNYDHLPIESSDISNFRQEIQTERQQGDDQRPEGGHGRDGRNGTGPAQQAGRSAARDADTRDGLPAGGSGDGPGEGNGGDAGDSGGSGDDGNGGAGDDTGQDEQEQPTSTDRSTGSLLPIILAFVLALLAVTLVYRYRDRLAALLGRGQGDEAESDGPQEWTGGPPPDDNVVFAAWDALLRDLDIDGRPTRTTGECATAATAEGRDEDAVTTLARTFEEVRYGKRPVTDDRRQQVTASCQRLKLDVPEGAA